MRWYHKSGQQIHLLLQVPIMNLLPRLPEYILARTKEPLIGQVAYPSSPAEALCMLAVASTAQHSTAQMPACMSVLHRLRGNDMHSSEHSDGRHLLHRRKAASPQAVHIRQGKASRAHKSESSIEALM